MRRLDVSIVAWGCICLQMTSAGEVAAPDRSSVGQDAIVATVDGEPIYLSNVDRLMDKVSRGQEVNPGALPVLQAQVLGEIVDRRLVLGYAQRRKSGATAAEIDAAIAELKSKLQSQGSSLERFLQQQSIGQADLRRQITWNLTWEKYLARYVTDARLQSHFQAHRREFDGTRASVSHVLLRPKADDRPGAISDLVKQAAEIRREITSGELSFAEAARKHSAAPSAKDGGRLGPIARHGAMVESFSRAAFALEVGQVSQPVITRFGVHLIRCDAIEPGSKPWTEVREQLETALARELLDRLARNQQHYLEQHRTPVEFTGKSPHFKPGTRRVWVNSTR